ncbi:transporter substrate-binding domain-containing protein [Solidesulfovibrio sp. C21]|uniref:transporter substrate-binding domain-containing protein n=1 Tax=Solidesulfovibrio sp. C21 TaxID=3398613 RepID=UPI0039FBD58C
MVRFIRIISLAFVALTMCCGTAVATTTPFDVYEGSNLRKIVQRGTLVVGMELKFWPFEYVDKEGKPVGFDVDIAKTLADRLGVKLEIKDMEWTGLIPALTAGKIDLIISGISGTLERAKSITFTSPYFTTGLCALLSTKKAGDVKSVEALNAPGRVLAVKTGTTADLVATKKFPKATINRYQDETSCVQEVVAGRADAFFYDQISIAKHHKQNPEATKAILTPFTYEPFCIALQKGDFDWWQWLEMYLATIKADGTLDALHAKYFKDILGK